MAASEIRYSKKERSDKSSIFEHYLKKTLENPELSKQYIKIRRLSSMIIDRKIEKKCTNGQTSFYIKISENELSRKAGTSILTQKSSSPIICGTLSQFTLTEIKYEENEITSLYEKLRELNTEIQIEIFLNRTNFIS